MNAITPAAIRPRRRRCYHAAPGARRTHAQLRDAVTTYRAAPLASRQTLTCWNAPRCRQHRCRRRGNCRSRQAR